jgi:hypothetical protein
MSFKQKLLGELKTYWMNVLYVTLFFSIFTDYRRLILAHYNIVYHEYGVSLVKGLILAKVILIAEHLHLGKGYENRPLIIPTLYKSLLFTICGSILSIIEFMVRGFFKTKGQDSITNMFMSGFSYEWFASILAIFVIFIPFFGIKELARVLGKGKMSELFFRRRPNADPNLPGNEPH